MNHWGKWKTIFILLLVCGLGVGIGLFTASHREVSPEAAGHEGHADHEKHEKGEGEAHTQDADPNLLVLSAEQKKTLQVKIEPVELRVPEENLAATGRVAANPDRSVMIGSRTPGRVVKVTGRLGQTVRAGEVLALLDSVEAAETAAELTQSESGLALAQARAEKEKQLYEAKLQLLEAGRRGESAAAAAKTLAQVELGRLKQEYIGALARLELAKSTQERQELLVERKIGARKDLLEANQGFISARAEVEAVADTIRMTARQELLAAETARQQARSQRDKVREKVRLLGIIETAPAGDGKANPGRGALLPLVAPFGGTLIERQVTEGQLIEPGFTAFRLADLSTVWLLLDVPETEAGRIRSAQEVVIAAVGNGGRNRSGRVAHIGEVVDEQTRTVKVRVELPNPDRLFKPGMFITARIATRPTGPPALLLPANAFFLIEDRSVVFVEGAAGFSVRPVETGERAGKWIAVRKGLEAGEKVVTEGGFALKAHLLKSRMGAGAGGHNH